MKKFSLICVTAALLLLLSACRDTSPPDTEPLTTEQDTVERVTGAPLDTGPQTVVVEPNAEIRVSKIEVKATGTHTVSALDLMGGMNREATYIQVTPSLGYRCVGFDCEGVFYEGDVIPPSLPAEATELTLHIDYATYELPIVNISVEGQAIDSKTEYTKMSFSLENTEDVLLSVKGGIRLRGNSTAEGKKKPYRIRFDQKQSLFGLEKAKSWVLLAEYLDPSCLHNYTAMYLGAASDTLAFTPTIHQVNLYLDGQYMGLYSLCEQVQVGEGRLDIALPVTADMTELTDFSFLVCMNERAPEEDQPYFYVRSTGRCFQLKYPKREDFVSEEQFDQFFTALKSYYNDMARAFKRADDKWIQENIHTAPLVDHLVIDQIMGEKDHVWKSFYTYHDATDEATKGKLCFGPIWDYDYSLYTPWTNMPNDHYDIDTSVDYSNFFYQGLMQSHYQAEVTSRYKEHYADVLEDCISHLRAYRDSIEASLALNQARWYNYNPDLTEDNFDFLISFLQSRQEVLKEAWA